MKPLQLRSIIFTIIATILIFLIIYIFYKINTTNVEFTKSVADISIEPDTVIDYKDFEQPNSNYKFINIMNEDVRKRFSLFMKKNNLKIKPGKYEINLVTGSYEDMLLGFAFETK